VISKDIHKIWKRAGMSADYDKNSYHTDSPEYRAYSQALFIELFNKNMVFKDFRPNNYCPACKTTIADAEIYYEELPTTFNHIKFKVKETGKDLVIATTRPELICACQIVLVNPDDKRYKKLHGKHAVLPFYNREVEIKPHKSVHEDFGTGIMMVCSYGDSSDIIFFRELTLEPIQAIDENGLMAGVAGKYKGLSVAEARNKILQDLKKEKLLVKQEKTTHRTPICERSKTPVEFIALNEWYLKQMPFLDDIRKMAGTVQFHPKQNKQILFDWIDSLTIDWAISRRRYYHTEIPLWYCVKCNKAIAPEPGPYYQPWKQKAPFKKCPKCGGTDFKGEDKVFDTWMDSSVSQFYAIGYKRDDKLFKKTKICSLRPQGRDIVRTWLYYSMLKGKLHNNMKPWEHAWIHGMGLDEHGRKMSKSLGNVIEPLPLIDKYGADAFRFWAASETNVGDDFRVSEDRVAGAFKFLTKLWNTARFISMFKKVDKQPNLTKTDEWLLAELAKVQEESLRGYKDFNFYVPANRLREFVWNIFAPHYLEMVKARAYAGDEAALFTLYKCLDTLLRLFAPITPFITDKVYTEIYAQDIHRSAFPEKLKTNATLTKLTDKLIAFNSEVWTTKKEKNMSLNAEISGVDVPKDLTPFKDDLIKMHNLK
jgi:valyl-tRNA synthetase